MVPFAAIKTADPRQPAAEQIATILSANRSFEIVPLETDSETTANASVGDLHDDGNLDIFLAKGRHWPLASVALFGGGKGHFTRGPALPNPPTRSYTAALADMSGRGHLDIVLSNDQPDRKLILLNDGQGHFRACGTFGDPEWQTRNIAVANCEMSSDVRFNRGLGKIALGPAASGLGLKFDCHDLPDAPSAASIAIADINSDGFPDVILPCRDDCQSLNYFNDGKGNFTRETKWGPPTSSTRAIAIGDFAGSGHASIAACHEKLGCFVYMNDGEGNLAAGIQFQRPDASPYSMITAD